MTPPKPQPSEGAAELAVKIIDAVLFMSSTRAMTAKAAALIDAELRLVLRFLLTAQHLATCEIWPSGMKKRGECTCGLAALMAKYQPKP